MKMKNKAISTLLAVILGISMSFATASPMTKSAQAAGKAPAKQQQLFRLTRRTCMPILKQMKWL